MALKTACAEMFADGEATASKTKAFALATMAASKADQVRVAELRAALDWLYECLISQNGAGNERRLSQSEELSMKELQLPSNSASDTLTHAKARYILAVIANMRGETEVCASNIAHMAAVAPRWFRAEFPAIFLKVFRPACQAAYDQLEVETNAVAGKSYRARVIAKRAAAVAVGTGIGAVVAGGMVLAGAKGGANPVIRQAVMGAAKPIWTSATPEAARVAELARIRSRFENRLDKDCRTLAFEIL